MRHTFPENNWGDHLYALLEYRQRQRRWPRRKDVEYFNDHLYGLKVDGSLQDPMRTFVTDKEYVKYYVGGVVGWQYVTETYRVLRKKSEVDELTLDRLPCVVKPTHLSGPVEVHIDAAKPADCEKLRKWLDDDYYRRTREQNYRGLRHKVIVEEFISEDGRTIPEDYKVFCFSGVPKLIQVDSDRFSGHTRNLYDTDWNRLPVTFQHPETSWTHPKPRMSEEMLDLAARISQPFSFIRVDMYVAGERIKVGELTNCPESACGRINPPTAEVTLGQLFAG